MNKKHQLATAIRAITLGFTGALVTLSSGALSSGAFAQEAPKSAQTNVEEVMVTGSRIKRNDLTSNSPIAVIDASELKLANTINPEEFLRSDPRFVAAVGSNTNNGNDGAATVDLRNLGEERTLVLMDGKRFTPYDYQGLVDLSMIPTALIERVEVVTGGASAVYGSDAIGGVVNFIMKKHFTGVEFDASTSSTFENDGKTKDFSLTFGGDIDGGKGNIVANLSYSKRDAVYQGDRKYSEFQLNNALEPGGSETHPNGTIYTAVDSPTLGAGAENALQFDDNGNLGTDEQLFNFNPFNLLQAPQEKFTGTVIATYDLTDDTKFFSRMSFANNQVNTVIAPSGTFFFPFTVNVDNAFLSSTDQAILAELDSVEEGTAQNDGVVDIQFGRRLLELGTRDSQYENTTMQFVAGLQGKIADSYDWEVFAQRGRTSRTQNFLNDFNYTKLQQGMLAVVDPDTGDTVCSDPSGGCVPVDVFGPNTITPEMAQYIRLNLVETNGTDQTIFGGSLSGDTPLTIPSATNPIGFAVGAEYRDESARNRPDDNYAAGNAPGFGSSSAVDAAITVAEYFGEVRVPVVEDVAFAKSVALEAAVRTANYENTVNSGGVTSHKFDNTSWKFGGEWAVNDEFRFRSLFQHAVRAPTMREIGLPRTPSTGDLDTDYCSEEGAENDPSLVALCEATGVPAGKTGHFTSIIAGQIANYVGGNPNLSPEKADTLTAGFVYTSSAMPLTLSVDYYDIKIDDVIVQLSEQSVIDGCYLLEKDPNGTFCSLIHRSPLNGSLNAGTETGADVSVINAGKKHTKGVDIVLTYDFDLNKYGNLNLRMDATHVMENIQQDGDVFPSYDCVGLIGTRCLRPDPKWRFVQTTSWNYGDLTMQLRWKYMSGLKQDAIVLGGADASDYAKPTIEAFSYFDLLASYELTDSVTLRAGINNLFDKQPPIVGNDYGGTTENSGNTFPATYDPLGRSGFVGVNARF